MFKILLLSAVLLLLAFLGLSVKLIFDKKSEFRAGSCSTSSKDMAEDGMSCGCQGSCSTVKEIEKMN